MAKSKKRKKQHHNPEKDLQKQTVSASASSETEAYEIPRSAYRAETKPQSDKPLFLRIVMIAIAAAMVIGIVFEAVAGLISG